MLLTLDRKKINIVAVMLQETWSIKYLNLINIPGYQNINCKLRTFSNGGGVGIFVKNGLDFKTIDMSNLYHEIFF